MSWQRHHHEKTKRIGLIQKNLNSRNAMDHRFCDLKTFVLIG